MIKMFMFDSQTHLSLLTRMSKQLNTSQVKLDDRPHEKLIKCESPQKTETFFLVRNQFALFATCSICFIIIHFP